MPKLVIDDREIEVAEGTKVIEAAQMLGIMIPRFCYHEAMGSIGACRVCAVKFVEGPVKGVQMSCMEDAADGMVVSTTDPEAMELRRYVIEWLMLNHPHDCPVCDEGGHCLLQDETVSGGHGIRRYLGKKRTYYDQYLGPFVQHEMNRCIHCLRCKRFYQDFAGYRDLGAMRIGSRTYFGRYTDGPLQSPFSGNLIDVCPTGVFTDKVARFRGRRWNLERGPSICLHCSLGCNTTGNARYREMLRQEARANEEVNGYFICDRGRFGFDFANHPSRPRLGRVRGRETPVEEAIKTAADELMRIKEAEGPGAVACLGSPRSSLETQAWLKRFCRLNGFEDPGYFIDPIMERKVRAAVGRLDSQLGIPMREVEGADFILAIGVDPVNEAPMLALAMRQSQRTVVSSVQVIQPINMMDPVKRAQRKGATVVVIDPRPVFLPLDYHHLPISPERIDRCIGAFATGAFSQTGWESDDAPLPKSSDDLSEDKFDQALEEKIAALSEKLRQSKRPVVVCGVDVVRETTIDRAAQLARLMRERSKDSGLFYVLPGPNAFGAALLSAADEREPLIEAVEKGAVKALVLVENDPLSFYPDGERLQKALKKLDFLLALDYLPSPSLERADIVLPTATVFEQTPSSYVNQEGRLQSAEPIHEGGMPLDQITGGSRPPRIFQAYTPGGGARPAAATLQALAAQMVGAESDRVREDIWTWLGRQDPVFFESALSKAARLKGVRLLHRGPSGGRVDSSGGDQPERSSKGTGLVKGMLSKISERLGIQDDERSHPRFELLLVDRTFGTEELSGYSRPIRDVEPQPELLVHPEEGGGLSVKDGEMVRVALEGGAFDIRVRFAKKMARGVLIVPRHRRLDWRKLKTWPAKIPAEAVRRV